MKFLWGGWSKNYLLNGMHWLHCNSNYPIMVSKSESRTSSISLGGIGVSGLGFWMILRFGFAYISDSLPVFSGLFDSFGLEESDFGFEESDFDLDSWDDRSGFAPRLFVPWFFDASVTLPVSRVLEMGRVFDLIFMLKAMSLRLAGRYSSVLYLFVDLFPLWKNSFRFFFKIYLCSERPRCCSGWTWLSATSRFFAISSSTIKRRLICSFLLRLKHRLDICYKIKI